MAIDTEARRRSVAGFSLFRIRLVPDGTIDADDRRHCAGFYAGISTASPAAALAGPTLRFTIANPGMRFTVARPELGFTVRNPEIRITVGG